MDLARAGAVAEKGPHTEEEKSRNGGNRDPDDKLPAEDFAVIGIGLMVVVIGKRTAQKKRNPKDKQDDFFEVLIENMAAQVLILLGNLIHTEVSFLCKVGSLLLYYFFGNL